MKKKLSTASKDLAKKKLFVDWKNRRDVVLRSVPVQVDLENRKIFFDNKLKEVMNLDFGTSNVDKLIDEYVDPKDTKKVMRSLLEAKEGMEKPISFQFIHPKTLQKMKLEYRYEIVYVTYSSTRLHGLLVNVPGPKRKSLKRPK